MTERESVVLFECGQRIEFSFEDMMRYHGPASPGGVAHAFKVLQRGLPLLSADRRIERRELSVRTAFGGPGARDGFELTCRAVSGERYFVDASLTHPERGLALERFVFRLAYRAEAAMLVAREGTVSEEFILLARKLDRTSQDEERLTRLKREMADRVMSTPAHEVYDVIQAG